MVRLPAGDVLPPPGKPVEPLGPAWVIFSAVSWILAGGLLGPLAAALLGALSGTLIGMGDTHSLFTVLEFALLGLSAGMLLQQRFRTIAFRLLRSPLAAALVLAACYPILFIFDTLLLANGTLAIRLDFALTRVVNSSLAVGGALLVGGLVAQLAALLLPGYSGAKGELGPSRPKSGLETRFFYGVAPLALALVAARRSAIGWWRARPPARCCTIAWQALPGWRLTPCRSSSKPAKTGPTVGERRTLAG